MANLKACHFSHFRFWKDGIITELSTKISRSAVFASCIAGILNISSEKITVGTLRKNVYSLHPLHGQGGTL